MRYNDPLGDAGRASRQRKVITALMKEAVSLETITKAGTILDILGETLRTNLTLDEMWAIQSHYRPALSTIEETEIAYTGKMIEDIWYTIVSEKEKARIRAEFRRHLKLE